MIEKLKLTNQDKTVIRCLAAGKNPKTVASELGVAYNSIYHMINRACLRIGLDKSERHKVAEKYKEICNQL